MNGTLGTALVLVILIAIVAAIIFKLHKDRKNHVSSCGGNCAHCPMGGSCHSQDGKSK